MRWSLAGDPGSAARSFSRTHCELSDTTCYPEHRSPAEWMRHLLHLCLGRVQMPSCGIASTRAIFIPGRLRRKTAASVYTSARVSIMLVSAVSGSRVLEIGLAYHVPRSSQS